jgi:hypothetical protein
MEEESFLQFITSVATTTDSLIVQLTLIHRDLKSLQNLALRYDSPKYSKLRLEHFLILKDINVLCFGLVVVINRLESDGDFSAGNFLSEMLHRNKIPSYQDILQNIVNLCDRIDDFILFLLEKESALLSRIFSWIDNLILSNKYPYPPKYDEICVHTDELRNISISLKNLLFENNGIVTAVVNDLNVYTSLIHNNKLIAIKGTKLKNTLYNLSTLF